MADVSPRALILLIQLLDEKVWTLKAKVDQASRDEEGLVELEDELAACTVVADELRASYEMASKSSGNLPPYGTLVRLGT